MVGSLPWTLWLAGRAGVGLGIRCWFPVGRGRWLVQYLYISASAMGIGRWRATQQGEEPNPGGTVED